MTGRLALLLLLLATTPIAGAAERSLSYWRIGDLALYVPDGHASRVVLLISGAKGWQEREAAAARALSAGGALVLGVDGPAYLAAVSERHDKRNDACISMADDFDAAARFVEKDVGFGDFVPPVVVGLDEGGALAYTLLAQAPPMTFRGAVGVGFCPVLSFSRPICPGNSLRADAPASGVVRLRPSEALAGPWMSIPQSGQAACDPHSLADFARAAAASAEPGGAAPAATHDPTRPWAPLVDAVAALSAPPKGGADDKAGSVDDLPLVEVAAAPGAPTTDLLAVLVTGDGGWAGIDKNIGRYMSERGIPVLGLDALRYFWAQKKPAVVAADLERVLRRYLSRWGRQRVLLIGYSLGADGLLFMVDGMPPDLRERISLLAMLNPGLDTDLEVHVGEWIGLRDKGDYPLAPVAARLADVPVLCVYSGEEKGDSLCPRLEKAAVVELPGNHHFDDDYERVGATILGHVR